MKLKIDEYEVKITAGRNGNHNEADTKALLNLLCIFAFEASKTYESRQCPWNADHAKRIANNIFNTLDRKGFYDGISI